MASITSKMQMLPFYRKKNNDLSLNVELSTNKLTPGILKIFGDHVSPGSNYKAVRVSTISTAEEVVREALEKFNLERCNPKDFVLCDVIGQFVSPTPPVSETPSESYEKPKKKQISFRASKNKISDLDEEKPEWVTEYVRAINEIEKPLVLQSLWKPTNGKSRRFELRNRIELENSFFFINNASSNEACNPMENAINGSMNSSDANSDVTTDPSIPTNSPKVSDRSNIRHSRRPDEAGNNIAPMYDPYLLMLKGCSNKDKLIHRLHDPTIIVGPYTEGEKKQCDVLLYASDILHPHCWIYKKLNLDENQTETDFDNLKYLAFVEPANGADVTINGSFVTTTTVLKPGELLTFGHDYVFLFKDQTNVKDSQIQLPWLELIKHDCNPREDIVEPEYAVISKRKDTRDKCIQVELNRSTSNISVTPNQLETGEDTDLSITSDYDDDKKRNNEKQRKTITKSKLQLSYNIEDEDELLHAIIEICDGDVGTFKLVPSYFFTMAIEHSAANFTDIETRKLLLKISSGLQGIAWEKTKEIGKKGSANEGDTMALHKELLPELRPVLFWLTNALQMLHFLQCNLKLYILPREYVRSGQHSVMTADEELLSVLEEVIMFTFQQLVYHLTKILYGALPAVLEVNPFQSNDDDEDGDDDEEKRAHPSILQITTILSDVLESAQEHQIHPQIITQIFSYLFFFCNALLFNSLMEKGPTTKIFRWAKGVQIRGNIDVIEEWAQINELGSEFTEYFGKFISVIGLLSTSKVQLLQYTWDQLRNDYPLLNPAQLQLILGEYQLMRKQKPREWTPSPDEGEAARRSSDVLESFATHPPLMLPSSNFVLDLNINPNSEDFLRHLHTLNDNFKRSEAAVMQPKARSHPTNIPTLNIQPIPQSATPETTAQQDSDDNVHVDRVSDKPKSPETSSNDTLSNSIHEEVTADHVDDIAIESQEPGTKVDVNVSLQTNVDQDEPPSPVPAGPSNDTSQSNITPRDPPPTNNAEVYADVPHDSYNVEAKKVVFVNDESNVVNHVDDDFVNMDGEVYSVELSRVNNVLGLGLIDGQFTPMKDNGIYIRTIVPNTPASTEPRLRIGDRILSVNDENVFDKDYSYAMGLIKTSGDSIRLLVSVSNEDVVSQIMAIA